MTALAASGVYVLALALGAALAWAAWPRRGLFVAASAVIPVATVAAFWRCPSLAGVILTTHALVLVLRALDAARLPDTVTKGEATFYLVDIMVAAPGAERTIPPGRAIAARAARGAVLVAVTLATLLPRLDAPAGTIPGYAEDLLGLVQTGAGFTGLVDLVVALRWALGTPLPDPHDARFVLAPSLGVFWTRWNRIISGICYRAVYLPAGGRTSPIRATLAVFLLTGVIHSIPTYTGFEDRGRGLVAAVAVQAFFLAHGVGVIADAAITRRFGRGALSRAFLYAVWLATAPLMPAPELAAIGARPFEAYSVGRRF